MKVNIHLTYLLGLFFVALFVTELEAASSIKTINNGSDLQRSVESIGDNELVYLDLTFDPSAVANSDGCDQGIFGPLSHPDNFEFQIKPVADNNHLLMTIIPGSKTQFPYNAVSCPYNSATPTEAHMRFRGYYVALHYVIPTAVLIELRPINPPK